MHTKHTQLGAGMFSTSCWLHKDTLDQEYIAHTGSIRVCHAGVVTIVEFNLGLHESQNLIAALQQHITYITQAHAELANINQLQTA